MPPCFSSFYGRDNIRTNPIGYSQLMSSNSRSQRFSNSDHLIRSQFCMVIPFSSSLSSFLDFILNVILMCPKKQMRRIHAWRIVTLMTDVQSFTDFTICHFIAIAMRSQMFLSILRCYCKSPISEFILMPYPQPAGSLSSALINLIPESLRWRRKGCAITSCTHARTILPLSSYVRTLRLRVSKKKRGPTRYTYFFNWGFFSLGRTTC